MSRPTADAAEGRRWIVPMRARSPEEARRASTPLELFFDLVFVVAIAQASSGLHHGLAEGRVGETILDYGIAFFALWWAWVNFTWFASAYDTDDVPYRLAVFVQVVGSLIMAAGIPRAFEGLDLGIVTLGYVVMRLALVPQWLRAARSDPVRRATALRYAVGVSAVQAGWVARLFAPDHWLLPAFFALAISELLVPAWAERAAATPWHPTHIAERYGLFTIIVLGESVLAASVAIQAAASADDFTANLGTIITGGLLILFSMWWLYFDRPVHRLTSLRAAFVWSYAHLAIFGSGAAVGAGLAVATEHATEGTAIGGFGAGAAVAVPVAIYLLVLWALHMILGSGSGARTLLSPAVALLVLLTPATGEPVLLTGLLLAGLLATKLIRSHSTSVRPVNLSARR